MGAGLIADTQDIHCQFQMQQKHYIAFALASLTTVGALLTNWQVMDEDDVYHIQFSLILEVEGEGVTVDRGLTCHKVMRMHLSKMLR